jgi:hypothetical protein
MQTFAQSFVQNNIYIFLHPLSGADEFSCKLWQLVTVVHAEGDGLILLE